jgi:hypothetical protein
VDIGEKAAQMGQPHLFLPWISEEFRNDAQLMYVDKRNK